jgi:hypothetical protein
MKKEGGQRELVALCLKEQKNYNKISLFAANLSWEVGLRG